MKSTNLLSEMYNSIQEGKMNEDQRREAVKIIQKHLNEAKVNRSSPTRYRISLPIHVGGTQYLGGEVKYDAKKDEVAVKMYPSELFNNKDIKDTKKREIPKKFSHKEALDYVERVFKISPEVEGKSISSKNDEYKAGYVMFYNPRKMVKVENSFTFADLKMLSSSIGFVPLSKSGGKIVWKKNPKVSGWLAPMGDGPETKRNIVYQ